MAMAGEGAATTDIRVKRAYAPAAGDDGVRVLVDRLWPRGLSKADAAIDAWRRDLAPSTDLRRWFGHAPERWEEFRRRYAEELAQQPEALAELRALAAHRRLTLLFGARDEARNNAVVLREALLAPTPDGSLRPARLAEAQRKHRSAADP
ncbi:MAG: DUF488 domain-containing protein [Solirubrobacterales bacterium]